METKYHDMAELSRLDDAVLDEMANRGELTVGDLVEAKAKRHFDNPTQPVTAPEAANDGFDDPYTAAVMKQLFPE